jgi:hypothetical protein
MPWGYALHKRRVHGLSDGGTFQLISDELSRRPAAAVEDFRDSQPS